MQGKSFLKTIILITKQYDIIFPMIFPIHAVIIILYMTKCLETSNCM